MKFKRPSAQIYRKHGKELKFNIKTGEQKTREVKLYVNNDWETRRNAFFVGAAEIDIVQMALRMRTRSKLDRSCCICGATENVVMHHLRHIRKAGDKPAKGFNAILRALNRKQIPVCRSCHGKIHQGAYDGLNLSDLAYDPR